MDREMEREIDRDIKREGQEIERFKNREMER